MATERIQAVENHSSNTEKLVKDLWEPNWLVDVGDEIMAGITLDDGCYVVLTQTAAGSWRPMTHVPVEAAKMLGRLAGD